MTSTIKKILNDPFYERIYEEMFAKEGTSAEEAIAFIRSAGYFDDNYTDDEVGEDINNTLDVMCTPLTFMKKNLGTDSPVILVATGAFNPIHDGHIEMMKKAKDYFNEKGEEVYGFFAPDHDEYIRLKKGKDAIHISRRAEIIRDRIRAMNLDFWFDVDYWPGLFAKHAINFTYVIKRLEAYIKKHTGLEPRVVFVFGSDNSYFMNSFVYEGECCVVGRPGTKNNYEDIVKDHPRKEFMHYVDNDNTMSSTEVLRGGRQFHKVEKFLRHTSNDRLLLRMEGKAHEWKLLDIMRQYFSDVEPVMVSRQQADFNNIVGETISLDPLIKGTYNLGVSRHYDHFGVRFLEHGSRPLDLNTFDRIPRGRYVLFDDDSCTGATMNYVMDRIAKHHKHIQISNFMTFTRSNRNVEILDARDFFLGDETGGLVIKDWEGNLKRVPYVFPFVDPYIRGSVNKPMEFSKAVWKLNRDILLGRGGELLDEAIDNYNFLVYLTDGQSEGKI